MRNKKKITLEKLKVNSFTTQMTDHQSQTVQGGVELITDLVCSWLPECGSGQLKCPTVLRCA